MYLHPPSIFKIYNMTIHGLPYEQNTFNSNSSIDFFCNPSLAMKGWMDCDQRFRSPRIKWQKSYIFSVAEKIICINHYNLLNPIGITFGIGSQNYFLVVRGDWIEVIRRKPPTKTTPRVTAGMINKINILSCWKNLGSEKRPIFTSKGFFAKSNLSYLNPYW